MERAGTWEGLTAWQRDQVSHAQLRRLLLDYHSFAPIPLQPGSSNRASLTRACKEQELMARMGSILCYEIHNVPYHSQMSGGRGGEAAAKCQVVVRLEWGWG